MKTNIPKSMVTVFIMDLTRLAKVQTTSVRKLSRNCFEILTVAQYDSFFKPLKLIGKIADLGLCQKEIERQIQPRTEIFKQTIVTEICFSHNWRHALAEKCEKSKKLCI